MGKTTGKADDLLAAIQRKAPKATPVVADTTEPHAPTSKAGDHSTAKRRKGEKVQFWFHNEDRRLVRELAAWLAGQGERTTDSLVIRACLRAVRAGDPLLTAYREAAQLDGRIRRD